MILIDIDSNIRGVLGDTFDLFERQIPFVMSQALADTAFETRDHIVNITWGQAFEVRNQRAPGVFFRVTDLLGQRHRGGAGGLAANLRVTGSAHLLLSDVKGRDWIKRQATGGTKTGHTGGDVAIPVRPGEVRGKSGRVRAPMKPLRITDKKKYYLYKKAGRKVAIMERGRKGEKNRAKYLFVPSTKIDKTFRFYEDSMDSALRFFPVAFDRRLAAILSRRRR